MDDFWGMWLSHWLTFITSFTPLVKKSKNMFHEGLSMWNVAASMDGIYFSIHYIGYKLHRIHLKGFSLRDVAASLVDIYYCIDHIGENKSKKKSGGMHFEVRGCLIGKHLLLHWTNCGQGKKFKILSFEGRGCLVGRHLLLYWPNWWLT